MRGGERVRLRLINGAASTYFRVQLDGHPLQITHADGLAVQPVVVDHLLMGMGETYDAVVQVARPAATRCTPSRRTARDRRSAFSTLRTARRTSNRDDAALRRPASCLCGPARTGADDAARRPVQTFRLPLQGDMARYIWMIDGQAWPKADPLLIHPGDRVQLELVNQTMMWHPMHLHGHFFRVLQGAGDYCPLKHTVNVAPAETVRIEFTADNPATGSFTATTPTTSKPAWRASSSTSPDLALPGNSPVVTGLRACRACGARRGHGNNRHARSARRQPRRAATTGRGFRLCKERH